MAKTASAEAIADKGRQPQFRSAVQLIRGGVTDVKSKIAAANEKIGEHWAKIEDGYKVHKTAGKFFAKIDKLEPDERADVLRSLDGLREASDWPELRDMVDDMETGSHPADDMPTDVAPKPKPPRGAPTKPKPTAAEAKAAAQSHLRVVETEQAPITADTDKDLAGE